MANAHSYLECTSITQGFVCGDGGSEREEALISSECRRLVPIHLALKKKGFFTFPISGHIFFQWARLEDSLPQQNSSLRQASA
jgi:hypothetical protein